MSIATQKRLRQGQRRTLTGTWVAVDHEPAPAWHDLVQAPAPTEPRTDDRWIGPEVTVPEREVEHPFSGRNRAERRLRLRGTGFLGSFSKELHHEQGLAWAEHFEAKRAMRANAAAAAAAKRYGAVDAGA